MYDEENILTGEQIPEYKYVINKNWIEMMQVFEIPFTGKLETKITRREFEYFE